MNVLRKVTIIVSNIKTPDVYLSKSYPDIDYNNNGKMELYRTPIYKVFIEGTDNNRKPIVKQWTALRFMPYWNDPKRPSSKYKTKGWANAGKHKVPKKNVTYYNPNYGTQNRFSPYHGAIQIDRSFLIHAGPQSLVEFGWGSAGCVEIIGNFDKFKDDIKILSGSNKRDTHDAILELVHARKLFVQVDYALPPKLKANLDKEVDFEEAI